MDRLTWGQCLALKQRDKSVDFEQRPAFPKRDFRSKIYCSALIIYSSILLSWVYQFLSTFILSDDEPLSTNILLKLFV
jgi:hypothetical protein